MAVRTSPPHRGAASGRRLRRAGTVLGIAALALLTVLVVSASVNLLLTRQEQSRFRAYGQRVAVDGGSLNVWQNGHSGQTMVLLGGLGTAAPALDFAPLIRRLGAYDVIVVEGFGYGYSDMSARPRTLENMTTELHEALAKIAAPKPYILVGHSIAGFSMLSFARRYPSEVSAVVGIDPTLPAAESGSGSTSGLPIHALGAILRMSGLVRVAYTLLPSLVESTGDAHTADQRAQMRAMAIWGFGNAALADETNRAGSNARALRGATYPDDLPVLEFLSTESVASMPDWLDSHQDHLSNVRHHEVVVLDGGHYLHWTQSKAMAAKISAFLSANLVRP